MSMRGVRKPGSATITSRRPRPAARPGDPRRGDEPDPGGRAVTARGPPRRCSPRGLPPRLLAARPLPRHGRGQRHAGLLLRRRALVRPGARRRHGLAAACATGADLVDVGGESTRPGADARRRGRGAAPGPAGGRGLAARGRRGQRRHHAGRVAERRRSRPGPRSSTTSAAAWPTRRMLPRWSPTRGVPYVVMHWRGHSDRDAAARASTTTSSPTCVAELRRAGRRGWSPPAWPPDAIVLDPGPRLRQERRSTTGRCCARLPRSSRWAARCSSAPPASASSASCSRAGDAAARRPRERDDATAAVTALAAAAGAGACGCTSARRSAAAVRVAAPAGRGAGRRREHVTPPAPADADGRLLDRIVLRGLRAARPPRRARRRAPRRPGLRRRRRPAPGHPRRRRRRRPRATVDYGGLAARLAAVLAGDPVDLLETLADAARRACAWPHSARRARSRSSCTSRRRPFGCRSATSPCRGAPVRAA